HILLFVFIFSVIALAGELASRAANPRRAHFLSSASLSCFGAAFVLKKVVLASIPFSGIEAVIYASAFSLATVTFVAGCVLDGRMNFQRLDSSTRVRNRRDSIVLWLFLISAAITVPALIGAMDWNSLLEKTWAVAYWALVSVVVVYRSQKPYHRRLAVPLFAAVLSLMAFRAGKQSQRKWAQILAGFDTTTALEYHSTLDASFSA